MPYSTRQRAPVPIIGDAIQKIPLGQPTDAAIVNRSGWGILIVTIALVSALLILSLMVFFYTILLV